MFLRRSKLRAPTPSPSWLPRGDLIATLRPGIRVLAIVAGPGYGKTVLASQLAATWTGNVLWFTCDDGDADLTGFGAHLRAMLQPNELETSAPVFAPPTPRELGATICDGLLQRPDVLVIVDDVHFLAGASLAALREIVEQASASGVSFILSGRELPDWGRGLAARGMLATISMDELAFDDAQSLAYLTAASAGRLGSDRIADLVRRIGGWPAGLALAASMPAHQRRSQTPASASLDVLFDYLAAEVLDALDEDERRFLLETSILDELDVEACDAVARTADARVRLARLAGRGLFIARSRDDAFEAHRLFAAVLSNRLERDYPFEARAALHERAVAVFARRGDHVRVIEHQIAAGRHDLAAESLSRVALALHAAGRTAQLARLLDAVGTERESANPILSIARGRLLHAAGAWDAALATLARAETLARARSLPDVAAEAVRALAPILNARGEHERLGTLLEAALALPLSDLKRTTVSITLGAYLLDRGRLDEVLELYGRIEPAVVELGDRALHGIVLHNTGAAHMRRGDPYAALRFYERALDVKRSAGQRVSALITLGNICVVLRAIGEVSAATSIAQECTREARAVGNATMLSHALENAGALALVAGDIDGAAELFDEACAVCDPSDTTFLPDALHGVANVALRRADWGVAVDACARSAALLVAPGGDQRRASVLVTRARIALAGGDASAALGYVREAFDLARRGADMLAATTILLDVAGVAAEMAPALTAVSADDARAVACQAAREALAVIAAHDYGFIERTRPDAFAGARALVAMNPPRPALRIELLGPMRVFVAGAELPTTVWKRRKARDILACLICERGHVVPRSRLIDTFWPDSDADAASETLRVCISAIRRAIGDVVRFDMGGYRFDPPPGTTVDIDELESALVAARRLRDRGDGVAARAAYAQALDLYRGDLLDGFDESTWYQRERGRLRDAALEAARALIADPEADVGVRSNATDQLLRLTPFDVDAMRVRLDGLAAARRIGEARTEYERWRERYTETFGDAPPEFWQPPRLVIAPRAS